MLSLQKFVSIGAAWCGADAGQVNIRSIQHTLARISELYPTRAAQRARGIQVSVHTIASGVYSDRSIRSGLSTLVKAGLIRRVRTKQPGAARDDVCKTQVNPALITLAREWAREQLVLNYPKPPTRRYVELPMEWPMPTDYNCILIEPDEAEFEEQTEIEMEIEYASL